MGLKMELFGMANRKDVHWARTPTFRNGIHFP
jgi:hypothetical protein